MPSSVGMLVYRDDTFSVTLYMILIKALLSLMKDGRDRARGSRVEYECWSLVGTLKDCVGI